MTHIATTRVHLFEIQDAEHPDRGYLTVELPGLLVAEGEFDVGRQLVGKVLTRWHDARVDLLGGRTVVGEGNAVERGTHRVGRRRQIHHRASSRCGRGIPRPNRSTGTWFIDWPVQPASAEMRSTKIVGAGNVLASRHGYSQLITQQGWQGNSERAPNAPALDAR